MLAISRFRYDDDLAERATAELTLCLERLRERPGFCSGTVGRAMDDPTLWVLQTRWENVGSYRRALSAYEIRMTVVPLLSYAVDEPSADEIVVGDGATVLNQPRPRS
jgi:quinol monooxygenase YgiN